MNKENSALKLVGEIILYYDARLKNIKLPVTVQVHNTASYQEDMWRKVQTN